MHRPVEIEVDVSMVRPGAVGLGLVFDKAMGRVVKRLLAGGVLARGQAANVVITGDGLVI
jgi:hypothetical protein